MRQDADDALPRLLLFLAQRAAQVGEDEQLVRPCRRGGRSSAAARVGRSPGRTADRSGAASRRSRYCAEPQLAGVRARPVARRLADQALRGGIDEHAAVSSMSKAKTATSIASMTLRAAAPSTRRASARWRCSVSPSALISRHHQIDRRRAARADTPRIE